MENPSLSLDQQVQGWYWESSAVWFVVGWGSHPIGGVSFADGGPLICLVPLLLVVWQVGPGLGQFRGSLQSGGFSLLTEDQVMVGGCGQGVLLKLSVEGPL